MSEVRNGDTAGDGSADASRAQHPARTRVSQQRRYIAEVKAAHRERIALLEEQHAQWLKAAAAEEELLDLEARAAEEGKRRDEAKDGEAPGDATQVVPVLSGIDIGNDG